MTQPSGADGPGEESQAHGTERNDHEARAETCLRLLAEAELRRALACPRGPAERIPPTAVRLTANAVGGVSGAVDVARRLVRPTAVRAGEVAGPWTATALRFLAPPARQVERALPSPVRRAGAALGPQARQAAGAVAPRARRARRAVVRAGWQARIAADQLGDRVVGLLGDRARLGAAAGPTPRDSLDRVHGIAEVLVAAGVLSEPTATSVTQGFGRALAARGLLDEYYSPRWEMLREHGTPAPSGPIVAAGVGARVDLAADDGGRASMHVLALVLAPDEALVTTVSWLTETPPGPEDRQQDWDDTLSDLVQSTKGQGTDNRGGTYRLRMDSCGGSSDGPWEAQLAFTPRPPAGLDWLDITLVPGQDPIRVDLTAASAEASPPAPGRASPAQRAERIIDSASELLLDRYDPEFEADQEVAGEEPADQEPAEITGLVRALRAAGALAPGSPALARHVTLTRRLGLPVPRELASADAAGPAALPEAWLAVLEQDQWSGTAGQASAATAVVVLPELDGARCVIAGLFTEADAETTTMQVLGWGWPWPGHMFKQAWQAFSWWARDDAGRWHRGRDGGYGSNGNMAEFQIELVPPVHPEATSLEITLSGMSGQVTATVPVTWARMP